MRNLFTKNNSKVSEKVEEDTKLDDFSTFFKERLSSQGLTYSTSSIVDENGNMKIFLLGTKNNSGYLYVNTGDNPQYVWITLVSALSAEPLKSKIKTDLEDLDYIDLRFSNKVFYKFGSTNINLTNTQSPTENQTKENSENSTSTSDINASTSNPFVKPIDHN